MQEQPVTDAELDAAKKYLIGSFPLKFDRQSEIVGFMLQIEIYGLGLDYADRYPKLIAAIQPTTCRRWRRSICIPTRSIWSRSPIRRKRRSVSQVSMHRSRPPLLTIELAGYRGADSFLCVDCYLRRAPRLSSCRS